MLTWNELVTRDELKKEYWNAANALDVEHIITLTMPNQCLLMLLFPKLQPLQ